MRSEISPLVQEKIIRHQDNLNRFTGRWRGNYFIEGQNVSKKPKEIVVFERPNINDRRTTKTI